MAEEGKPGAGNPERPQDDKPKKPKQDDDRSMVFLRSWPKEKALLEHSFDIDKPCPVGVSFDTRSPASVVIRTTEKEPLHVGMGMTVTAPQDIPVCFKLCEPITARSEYDIGIVLFDRPLATISVRGTTRLFNSGGAA